jgi:hypothetical protein
MKTRIVSIVASCMLAAAVCVCRCTRVAGPTTDEGNPQLVAIVVDKDKKPVGRAEVSVLRMAARPDSAESITGAVKVAGGVTSTDGKCSFDNLVSGMYSIQGLDTSGAATGIKMKIFVETVKKKSITDTIVLLQPGEITGVVTRGPLSTYVQNSQLGDAFIQVKLQEIDQSFITNGNGKYHFSGVPAGTYTVMYYASNGFYSAIRDSIVVAAGSITKVDTVFLKPFPVLLPPQNFSAHRDTANGLVYLSWSTVRYVGLRWYELDRIDANGVYSRTWHTIDTASVDTVKSIPASTMVYYVVRSVDSAFNMSKNAGPLQVTMP